MPRSEASTKPLNLITVFKYKYDPHGKLAKRKVRICVGGHRAKPGLHYDPDNVYAPTLSHRSAVTTGSSEFIQSRPYNTDAVGAFLQSDVTPTYVYVYPVPRTLPSDHKQMSVCLNSIRCLWT